MNGTFDPSKPPHEGGYVIRADANSSEYEKASKAASAASAKFREAQVAYRSKKIGDKEFLEAKRLHDTAQAEFDKAFAKEQARGDAIDTIKFEARIYEKAEHWTFDTTVDAKDEADARRLLSKEYPKSEYTIQDIRRA